MITKEQLNKILLIKDEKLLLAIHQGLIETATKFAINTNQRMMHFLAQILHESANLTAVKENLNYSASALVKVFPKYFSIATSKFYERQPMKIANKVYGNRMGNGPEASGDGWRFRGRSYIQLTGKNNYQALSKSLGVNLITNPELLETPKYAMLAAGWFWNDRKLNALADISGRDVTRITKVVNGGVNGLADRQAKFNKLLSII